MASQNRISSIPWVAGINEGDVVEIAKEIISTLALAMNRKILDLIDGNSQVYYPQWAI